MCTDVGGFHVESGMPPFLCQNMKRFDAAAAAAAATAKNGDGGGKARTTSRTRMTGRGGKSKIPKMVVLLPDQASCLVETLVHREVTTNAYGNDYQ